MPKPMWVAIVCITLVCGAAAQQFDFPEAAASDPAALSRTLSTLASQIIVAYKESDQEKYFDNLFRLQLVAGNFAEALKSIGAARDLRRATDPGRAAWQNVQYEIYASARLRQQSKSLTFDEAFRQAFRDRFTQLDDPAASIVIRALGVGPARAQGSLQGDLSGRKGKSTISLADALKIVRDYQVADEYREFSPLIAPLTAEDDARRYVIEKDVAVKAPSGGTVCALIVRPRIGAGKLPTLLEFTIYAQDDILSFSARPAASHGYIGVVGLVRGKGCSPDEPIPYVHDADDIAALIDWISVQPWSDGRVGMFGGSYSGGSAWAVTKRMPKALKAIDVGAPVAPGIDVPMEGNVFWNFVYPWPFYTTDLKGVDDEVYYDNARWQRLNHNWYMSGRAYRDLDKIDGKPNPIFDEWISHPSYDAYWQGMIPYRDDFARINIPVLQTAGYYYGGPGAAVYYFTQHYRYAPNAEHYLVIGPYDHPGAQHGTVGLLGQDFDELSGYKLDPVALIDLEEVRYQWFDYVLKGNPKPALLKDKVNYEVTGANVWKHAPSLAAMHNQMLRFHLTSERSGDVYRLSTHNPAARAFTLQSVKLADRSDVDRKPAGGGVLDTAVDTWNAIEFVSEPFPAPIEMSGLFSGHLDFLTNKKDFDFEIDLYELTPKGEYIQLAPYWSRASYVGDRSRRRLLTPGKRARLDFQSVRLMSRELAAGSRAVAVLRVIKESGRQINYGTGKDVSDETTEDARVPLEIKWFSDSYIDIPASQ